MAQAQLPAPESSTTVARADKKELIAHLLADGMSISTIATRLAKGDKHQARRWRHTIRQWTYNDAGFQRAMALAYKGEALIGAVESVAAVGRRAKRGRVDAHKFLAEASGLHNPKVKHEHSGEVTINLKGTPRPVAVETVDSVAEAEVVE